MLTVNGRSLAGSSHAEAIAAFKGIKQGEVHITIGRRMKRKTNSTRPTGDWSLPPTDTSTGGGNNHQDSQSPPSLPPKVDSGMSRTESTVTNGTSVSKTDSVKSNVPATFVDSPAPISSASDRRKDCENLLTSMRSANMDGSCGLDNKTILVKV